jgi:glutaredoxin
MKTLIEINNGDNNNPSYNFADSRLNQTIPLRNFYSVKKMPNEYFNNKYKKPLPVKNQQYTQKNKVWVLYGKETCPFCKSSIRLINNILKKDDEFIYIDINNVSKYNKTDVLYGLKDIIENHNTVPIIFCNNEFIGGNSELNNYFKK